ncbi:hypothetical protein FGG79_14505 [Bacillus sp. BHET2]|uniref:hypothetical protein n=1 Tax=Bacillus sp. BHET2 TaxID=2583818 RepID=UPI00110E2C27|nr:hypothetical protein [Bacillus sp. BHET2]TMU85092.1 hypothetical protein FGG79_14505 [Bacillus sp. BHET2]
MQLVKVIRFDRLGFTCHSPKSDCKEQKRNPVFLNRKIHNLFQTGLSLYTSEMVLPSDTDRQWSGCYCHLDEYSQPLSVLGYRHIGFLPRESVIWVRNRSHIHGGIPYYNRSIHPLADECGSENMIADSWIEMRVADALERKRLWKEQHDDLPDWITECYLIENQVRSLIYPSTSETVMEFWLSKN